MPRNKLNELEIQTRNNDIPENEYYLNLPDLVFFHKCYQQYNINKEVFNTIDNWFYEQGVNVLNRRRYVIACLEFVHDKHPVPNSQKFMKFGHGGLTVKLREFINKLSDQ